MQSRITGTTMPVLDSFSIPSRPSCQKPQLLAWPRWRVSVQRFIPDHNGAPDQEYDLRW